MATKFIGRDGFCEIESLSAPRKKTIKLNTAQKTLRFTKRLAKYTVKEIKISLAKFRANENRKKLTVLNKERPAKVKNTSVLDKCYNADRRGNVEDFNVSVTKLISDVKHQNGRKYAHCAPTGSGKVQRIVKSKAMLASVSCLVAVMFSCLTVANALDTTALEQTSKTAKNISSADSITPLAITATTGAENYNIYSPLATADEVFSPMITTAALIVDGEMIGATSDYNALYSELDKVLADYRAEYDDETTTEFANDVEVVRGEYSDAEMMTAAELVNAAKDKFSISLSTDMFYTVSVDYETEYEYDDTQGTSYSETVTEGVDGEALVTLRTTFVDGVQTDCVQTDYEITTEPVSEVVVVGSNEDIVSYSASGTFVWPVPYTSTISSYYGYRWGTIHTGIDISDSGINGQAIVASDAGTVEWAGYDDSGYGNYVIIDHGNGYKTLYGHCSSVEVSAGESVSQGETIAYIGSTGNSTGPHLHFEIRTGKERLDPMLFL